MHPRESGGMGMMTRGGREEECGKAKKDGDYCVAIKNINKKTAVDGHGE
jgi:hypothetical protein